MTPLRVTAPMPGTWSIWDHPSGTGAGWPSWRRGWKVCCCPVPGNSWPRPPIIWSWVGIWTDIDRSRLRISEDEAITASTSQDPESPDLLMPRLLGPEGAAAWTAVGRRPGFARRRSPSTNSPNWWRRRAGPIPSWPVRRPGGGSCGCSEHYGDEPLSALRTIAPVGSLVVLHAGRSGRQGAPLSPPPGGADLGRPTPGWLHAGSRVPVPGDRTGSRQHYESLVRVTDSLLVLYQEKSPLPSEASE